MAKKKYTYGGITPEQMQQLTQAFTAMSNTGSLGGVATVGAPAIASSLQGAGASSSPMSGIVGAGGDIIGGIQGVMKSVKQAKSFAAQNLSKGMDMVAGIVASNNSAKAKQREQELYAQSLIGQAWTNDTNVQQNVPVYAKYGASSKSIEAEKGEVFTNQGEIYEISESANSHAEGGVRIQADQVLENAATRYKTPLAKALQITPDQAKSLGVNTNKNISHADLYKKIDDNITKVEDKVSKAIEFMKKSKSNDPKMLSSLELNQKLTLNSLPSRQDVFNNLLAHQEQVKQGFKTNGSKAAYGLNNNEIPYLGTDATYDYAKNSIPYVYAKKWGDVLGKDYNMKDPNAVKMLQQDVYDWHLTNDKESLKKMWSTYGNTNYGKTFNSKIDFKNMSDEDLKTARDYYSDNMLGARTLPFNQSALPEIPVKPNSNLEPIKRDLSLKLNPIKTPTVDVNKDFINEYPTEPIVNNVKKVIDDKFNVPLKWYDLAEGVGTVLSALNRDPEYYNPANLQTVRLARQDYRPMLNQSQAEYNASKLGSNNSVNAAINAQLLSNKVRMDNQAISQTQAANTQIANQEALANNEIKNKQELLNQQSRELFQNKVLTARAKQQEQLLTGIGSISKTIAENRAFNANGNLLMKYAPNFNQNAEYNGKQTIFTADTGNPNSEMVPYRTTDKNGKQSTTYITRAEYEKIIKSQKETAKKYTLNSK